MTNSQQQIEKAFDSVKSIVLAKNKKYGDSALNPIGIFGKHVKSEENQSTQSILIRLDDKLNRVKNGDKLLRNDVVDIAGYLGLLMVDKGWLENEDLID